MKNTALHILTVFLFMWLIPIIALAGGDPPAVGETLPVFSLPAPKDLGHRSYLGIPKDASFKISQINAKVVIIEIFSMYCPYCQREAPNVNQLFQRIENDPSLEGKIKMIGIGAGNSLFEVNIFRRKYHIPFPLFPDQTFSIHKCVGEVRTPYFFAVKILPDGTHRVIYSKLGGLSGIDQFLRLLIEGSGLSQEG